MSQSCRSPHVVSCRPSHPRPGTESAHCASQMTGAFGFPVRLVSQRWYFFSQLPSFTLVGFSLHHCFATLPAEGCCQDPAPQGRGTMKTLLAMAFFSILHVSAKDIEMPGELDCLVCNGDPNLCGGQTLPTVRCSAGEAHCVEMSIAGSLKEGERTKRMIKGCGMMTPCGGLAAFSNGEHPVSYSADVKCCNGSECNSGIFSEVDPGDENGVECHSCLETGKGECSRKNMKSMKCLGAMTQCMVIRGKTSDQTLMRGCATEPFCQGLYPDFKLNTRNRTTCCAGSLCNHGYISNQQHE